MERKMVQQHTGVARDGFAFLKRCGYGFYSNIKIQEEGNEEMLPSFFINYSDDDKGKIQIRFRMV